MSATQEHPVVVLGGGIAGLTAALELHRAGVPVALVEKSPFFGGRAAAFACKATDVCQKCGACRVEQALRDLFASPEIALYPHTELVASRKENGLLHLTLNSQPRLIDPQRCIDCGICLTECPAPGAVLQAASAENHPRFAINPAACLYFQDGSCRRCQEVCPTQAIDLSRPAETRELATPSLIVATGYQPGRPRERAVYGKPDLRHVITGAELEAMLKAGGPLVRPDDGRLVRRLAFIQCVGSRDQDHPWCSRVCCGYGLRLARLVRHRWPETRITTFYMDLQNVGSDPQAFEAGARRELELIRALPGDLTVLPDGNLRLRFLDEGSGRMRARVVDLLVLAVGIQPAPDNPRLAELLDLSLTTEGFFQNGIKATPPDTPAVFVAGTAGGPMSILECIAQGTRSAQQVCEFLEARP